MYKLEIFDVLVLINFYGSIGSKTTRKSANYVKIQILLERLSCVHRLRWIGIILPPLKLKKTRLEAEDQPEDPRPDGGTKFRGIIRLKTEK